MNWFTHLSTRGKLFCGLGLIVALLAVAIATGYRSMADLQGRYRIVTALHNLQSNFNEQRVAVVTMLTAPDRAAIETLRSELQATSRENDELTRTLLPLTQDDPLFRSKIEEFTSRRLAHRTARDEQVVPLILAGNNEEARTQAMGAQRDNYRALRAVLAELSEEAVRQGEQIIRKTLIVFLTLGVVAIALSIFIAVFLGRSIADPLREISVVAEKIASGDLTMNTVAIDRRDEVGALSRTFAQMTRSLRDVAAKAQQIAAGDLRVQVSPQSDKDVLANAFATMAQNLRRTTTELTEGVNVLASSASEILAATSQVASGAAETSTAIAQTTTTVEEVKQTAQVSSQKAKYVADSAQKATQVAQTGRKSVESSIEGMKRIQAQMESIAESVVKLSEQSQAIGEIIAAVNDLAEQSNLLAVNAAIEAAKAGEQGKGFAVVAQEVKSLAEQSKQATAQVRGILNDIQKATTAAVLATEQGSKAVELGMKQSAEAGESIRQLADSITEAAQAATQIAASSQQQLIGTDQVALAMENIKQASTQNVAGTKQSEAAAHNLHELGQKLKVLVAQYQT